MILVPSDGGRFEIFVDDRQIYSKLDTGTFPEPRDVIKAIEAAQSG
jgi:selenoprotein W-related protein